MIRRAQLERPPALRAVELGRSNTPRFAFTRDRNRKTEFRQSHFAADKHQHGGSECDHQKRRHVNDHAPSYSVVFDGDTPKAVDGQQKDDA